MVAGSGRGVFLVLVIATVAVWVVSELRHRPSSADRKPPRQYGEMRSCCERPPSLVLSSPSSLSVRCPRQTSSPGARRLGRPGLPVVWCGAPSLVLPAPSAVLSRSRCAPAPINPLSPVGRTRCSATPAAPHPVGRHRSRLLHRELVVRCRTDRLFCRWPRLQHPG